ncbi:MAG: long-chain-fatty-acid--CoA ligase [Xanthomonadales bacterium]|nr:long-chain-fatty-acid--CoA ligase [Xanthomonadales bacterium]NIN60084.1 long-chain-fatty-acid--CoA ligase [Xanthomonadales bacterium]NIN75454.1 long-chain-fatty-acid--CoA ligase [Xanthomonadales bacterium]NIO13550.1 long-chain-fatty-acid--CoA ligase [Xanthomonadales bacterium]NIP12477.1 long-chain-fatty-acid--CoA ligase [Xanthomonadales bacterium]
MRGLMQDYPLLVHTILDHAALNHGEREIVTRAVEGPIRRCTLSDLRTRSLRVAKALQMEGIGMGDRVATMAWNTDRHVETWYGIMGLGAICHTLNPRLFAEQLAYIINHAEDRLMFVDLTFVPLLEALAPKLPTIEKYIVLTDAGHLPESGPPNMVAYEDWLAQADADFAWVRCDENTAAALCYTSGTTGNPKGVLYSHRSNVLHGLMVNQPDVFGLTSSDVVMAIVPMFHANAWALTYAAPAAGASMVMPGAGMDGERIYELLDQERVTATAAVPTVWLGLLQYLEETGKDLPWLKSVVVGGAACPRMMIEKFENVYDVEVIHGWGMTEMSPVGTTGSIKHATAHLQGEARVQLKLKQGRSPYLVEMKVVDDDGNELPRDGKSFGHLLVRGPAIASGYFKHDEEILDADGWFDTGDIAHIDALGYMQITDRDKDVIKSGGEWISSIEVENTAVGCPGVTEAAVIGIAHPKWGERPLLLVVAQADAELGKSDVLDWLQGRIAKWWMPDEVLFVDEIPHTATGKIQKNALREQYRDFQFSE